MVGDTGESGLTGTADDATARGSTGVRVVRPVGGDEASPGAEYCWVIGLPGIMLALLSFLLVSVVVLAR